MTASGLGGAQQERGTQSLGMTLAVLTGLFFASSDALIKQLVIATPFVLVIGLRYLFQVGILLAWCLLRRRPVLESSGSWRLQGLRCVCLTVSTFSGYLALRTVPLAEYTALMMLAPVAAVVLGRVVLKEPVSPSQWGCVAVSLVGMLAVVRPGLSGWTPQAWLAVLSACAYAAFQMVSRQVMRVSDVVTSSVISALCILAVSGLCLLIWPIADTQPWIRMDLAWWWHFLGMCALATGGQIALAAALQKNQLSVTAPFAYLQIVFAAFIGLLFFGHWPSPSALAGSLLITAAGIGSAWLHSKGRV